MILDKYLFLSSRKVETFAKPQSVFLKLNIVAIFTEILTFCLTFASSSMDDFIVRVNIVENKLTKPTLFLMENGRKNRSGQPIHYIKKNKTRIIHKTPQQNLSECLFGVIEEELINLPSNFGEMSRF